MAKLKDRVEINLSNMEPRQALVVLLDVSGSMEGTSIAEVREGIASLGTELRNDEMAAKRVEVAIVTFGGDVQVAQDFVEVSRFEPPTIDAGGDTPMGEAILMALDMAENRKQVYKTSGLDYYRPWIFLVTDGGPTDEWEPAAQRVRQAEDGRKVAFFAVGTKAANFDTLKSIASPKRPPLRLEEGRWKEMFAWLSKSMQTASRSKPGEQSPIESPAGWGSLPT